MPLSADPDRRRHLRQLAALGLGAAALDGLRAQPRGLEPIRFATNWRAQAAHGGFYQALVDGGYARAGLDVSILQGGPQVNNRPLLPAKRIDFLMGGNLLHSFDNQRNGVPTVAVAAVFQKDPQALIAHPGQGHERFEALKDAPVALIAKDAQYTWWAWLKARHGFRDAQLRPYTYNLGPFLANPRAVQQGYAVAEPIYVKQQGGFEPVVHLLADHGFSTYSTLIEAHADTVKQRPDTVRRFVEASLAGWQRYLHGDRRAAHARMRQDNPDVGEAELEDSVARIRRLGLVEGGDAPALGLGAMRVERIRDFLAQMVDAGLYRPGEIDAARIAELRFVNAGPRQTPR